MSHLKVFTDGASRGNPGPASSAFIVQDSQDKVIHQESKYLGQQTNNFAEYTALLLAHTWLVNNQAKFPQAKISFYLDSELIVKQLTGQYKIKSQHLLPLVLKIKSLAQSLSVLPSYHHVVREKNFRADSLANQAIDNHAS